MYCVSVSAVSGLRLQDVSDRIEKNDMEDFVVQCLESGGPEVLKYDWKLHISPELQHGTWYFHRRHLPIHHCVLYV